jgi:hypothetical protein
MEMSSMLHMLPGEGGIRVMGGRSSYPSSSVGWVPEGQRGIVIGCFYRAEDAMHRMITVKGMNGHTDCTSRPCAARPWLMGVGLCMAREIIEAHGGQSGHELHPGVGFAVDVFLTVLFDK